jgi:hypothetical protein
MNPARTLGPDIVGNDYTGWWVYVAGPVIGAAIAVMIIGLVRGLPDKQERKAAEGGDLPILGAPSRPRMATEKAGHRPQLQPGIGNEHVRDPIGRLRSRNHRPAGTRLGAGRAKGCRHRARKVRHRSHTPAPRHPREGTP